jgi:LysM repeat protein
MRWILQNQKVVLRRREPARRPEEARERSTEGSAARHAGFRWRAGALILAPVAVAAITCAAFVARPGLHLAADPSLPAAGAAAAREALGPAEGTGALEQDRSTDLSYTVQDGETLSEIAYVYKLDYTQLAIYNNLSNPSAIKPGQRLVIPSLFHAASIKAPTFPKAALAISSRPVPGQQIHIDVDQQNDGRSVTAHFTLKPPRSTTLTRYQWDLGDGRWSFRDSTFNTYDKPGTYNVSAKAWDTDGRLHTSNTIYITVPHPGAYATGNQRFITLDEVGQPFDVDGVVSSVLGYDTVEDSPIVPAGSGAGVQTYAANKPGFFNLTVDKGDEASKVYLFVSPIPSKQIDRADVDWYRTQFNTGTQSNCGPSMVSMAIAWARGDYVPVASVREAVGWHGDGGIGFEDMIRVLAANGVRAELQPVWNAEDIRRIIDQGKIAVFLYNTRSVHRAVGDPTQNLFGSYYTDNVGHYVLIKGYSLDGKWFVVYDPIPSDWASNSARYGDGISMIGRNRYYAVSDLFATIRLNSVLVVSR